MALVSDLETFASEVLKVGDVCVFLGGVGINNLLQAERVADQVYEVVPLVRVGFTNELHPDHHKRHLFRRDVNVQDRRPDISDTTEVTLRDVVLLVAVIDGGSGFFDQGPSNQSFLLEPDTGVV